MSPPPQPSPANAGEGAGSARHPTALGADERPLAQEAGEKRRGGLPPTTTFRILTDGRAGHEAQTLGVAEALGLAPDIRKVAPRHLYNWLAPFAPADPGDADAFAPPYPDIAFAAGRRTLPALRRLKRASGGRTFTVYFNRPATGLDAADLIIAPRHDRFTGPNVITPLTPPNRVTTQRLAQASADPDPRIADLRAPRVAMLLGDASGIVQDLDYIATVLIAAGASVMATPSRRTTPDIREKIRAALSTPGGWFWNGDGDNPYFSMLANADRIIVTGDSVNMVGEAVATGVPVHVIEPYVTRSKLTAYLTALEDAGAVQIWRGRFDDWSYEPINSTRGIAQAIVKAFRKFQQTA